MTQVSSRGCSRAFVLCVLYRCLVEVQQWYEDGQCIRYPFQDQAVTRWIEQAKVDAADRALQSVKGYAFDLFDRSSYWTSAKQFFTWWKNNVERKQKRAAMEAEAEYLGEDPQLIARAKYCATALAIASNIKRHFARHSCRNGHRTERIELVPIPFEFPTTMPRVKDASVLTPRKEVARDPTFNLWETLEHYKNFDVAQFLRMNRAFETDCASQLDEQHEPPRKRLSRLTVASRLIREDALPVVLKPSETPLTELFAWEDQDQDQNHQHHQQQQRQEPQDEVFSCPRICSSDSGLPLVLHQPQPAGKPETSSELCEPGASSLEELPHTSNVEFECI